MHSIRHMDHWNFGTRIWQRRDDKNSIWKKKLSKYSCQQYCKSWTNLWTSKDQAAFLVSHLSGPISQSTWRTWSIFMDKRLRKLPKTQSNQPKLMTSFLEWQLPELSNGAAAYAGFCLTQPNSKTPKSMTTTLCTFVRQEWPFCFKKW